MVCDDVVHTVSSDPGVEVDGDTGAVAGGHLGSRCVSLRRLMRTHPSTGIMLQFRRSNLGPIRRFIIGGGHAGGEAPVAKDTRVVEQLRAARYVTFQPPSNRQRRFHHSPACITMSTDEKQTIVHINASITHDSVTARVANAMIDHLTHHFHRHVNNASDQPQAPEDVLNIEELDVWGDQLPKFDRDVMQKVWRARNNSQDEADIAAFRPIQKLAEQLLRADFLMITVPVWNFSVPYVVKQYIDCIVQPGLTFKNADASGPSRPYFKDRPLIIISSSGGKAPPPNEDFVVPFLSKIFAMCGFDDAHHVAIEGLATHDKQACFENAVNEANAIADQVVQNHKLRLEANDEPCETA